MKILITGAHFTPAQAVIEQLLSYPDIEVIYIGRNRTREGDRSPSMESQILPKLGVKFIPLVAGRLRLDISIHTILNFLKIPIGFIQAFFYVLREQPDVVLSFGGYVGVPVVVASWLLSVPIVVHEQTLVSGLANSISNIFADKIAISFPKKYSFKKNRVVLTGNPMRKELLENGHVSAEVEKMISGSEKQKMPLMLITGGNQGSHAINQATGDILEELTKKAYLIHQTGDSKFQDYESLVEKQKTLSHPERYLVKKWLDATDMGGIFKQIDLAVARAGANTLLELAYFGVPSLVIPLPFSIKNEQKKNAQYFEKLGLASVLPQSQLNSEKLLAEVTEMLHNRIKLKHAAREAKEAVIPDAASRLTQETLTLTNYEANL